MQDFMELRKLTIKADHLKPVVFAVLILSSIIFSCTGMNPDPNGDNSGDDSSTVPAGWTAPELFYAESAYFPAEVITSGELSSRCLQAPGQFANDAAYNIVENASKLLGPPSGGGTAAPDLSSVVSLGMAGGSVVLRFDPPIENHPDNIGGYDFIVFGNSYFYGGDPSAKWQEPGVIWVKKDSDSDGIQDPDEKWYLIPGSHLSSSDSPQTLTYDNDAGTAALPAAEKISTWWPTGMSSPLTITGQFLLPDALYDSNGAGAACYGYADVTPTLLLGDLSGADGGSGDNSTDDAEDYPDIKPVYFYTMPDTPGDSRIDAGSGGGDAVDIGTAVDPDTFEPANLDKITWIKIVSGTQLDGAVGEYSVEVDAVARVRRSAE